jgi:hypothetical protein
MHGAPGSKKSTVGILLERICNHWILKSKFFPTEFNLKLKFIVEPIRKNLNWDSLGRLTNLMRNCQEPQTRHMRHTGEMSGLSEAVSTNIVSLKDNICRWCFRYLIYSLIPFTWLANWGISDF